MVINAIRDDPAWNGGNYSAPTAGWLQGYEVLRMMIDGVPRLQAIITDTAAANEFIASARKQAAATDANDILYSLELISGLRSRSRASLRSNARSSRSTFRTTSSILEELQVLDRLVPHIPNSRFFVQQGSASSWGHLTMAHPALWAAHVGDFMA